MKKKFGSKTGKTLEDTAQAAVSMVSLVVFLILV